MNILNKQERTKSLLVCKPGVGGVGGVQGNKKVEDGVCGAWGVELSVVPKETVWRCAPRSPRQPHLMLFKWLEVSRQKQVDPCVFTDDFKWIYHRHWWCREHLKCWDTTQDSTNDPKCAISSTVTSTAVYRSRLRSEASLFSKSICISTSFWCCRHKCWIKGAKPSLRDRWLFIAQPLNLWPCVASTSRTYRHWLLAALSCHKATVGKSLT